MVYLDSLIKSYYEFINSIKFIDKENKVENNIIVDAKFKTFGCGSAIASSSLVSEWVKGKSLAEAGSIKNTDIARELVLPPVKIHCSVLAEDAIKAAIKNYKDKQEAICSCN